MTLFEQTIDKQALSPIHLAKGLELCDLDTHVLALMCNGKVVVPYSVTGVRVEHIRKDADEFLERNMK